MQLSMFSAEEPRASHSALRGLEKGWLTLGATSCSHSGLFLGDIGPSGWYGGTSPVFCPAAIDALERELEQARNGINTAWADRDMHCRRADDAEARAKRLEEALQSLVALNDGYSPFGGEIYQDRVNRTWERARAALKEEPTNE